MIYELPRDILIHGVYSTRKTSRAMTVSKNYPAHPLDAPFKEVVRIEDVCIVAWDSQASLSLPHLNIDLDPKYIFNTHGRTIKIPGKDDELIMESMLDTINASFKWAFNLVKNHGVKFIIHDTISAKDSRIVTYWSDLFKEQMAKDPGKKGGDQSQVLYRNVLATHTADVMRWQNLSNAFGITNIWLCHTGIKGQDAPSKDKDAIATTELQRKMKGLLGAELAARITGASWNYFYEQCRMVYYQTVEQVGYSGQEAFWTTRSADVAVKPGLPPNVVADKIPADFRLLFKLAAGGK